MVVRHAFEFGFDIPFIKAALRRDLLWKGYLLAGGLLLLAVVLRLTSGSWDPVLTRALALGAVVVSWSFHSLLGKFAGRVFDLWARQSPNGIIRYELGDETFAVVAGASRSEFQWKGLRRLWRYDDAWMLEIVKMQSVFFPPDEVPREVLDFIVERCAASGVRV